MRHFTILQESGENIGTLTNIENQDQFWDKFKQAITAHFDEEWVSVDSISQIIPLIDSYEIETEIAVNFENMSDLVKVQRTWLY